MTVNIDYVGNGRVYLIAGGGRTYCDVAAKFCRTSKDVESIIASPQAKQLIKSLLESGHKSALEFDNFIFGIEGFSRVTEVQLVRKRHASYNIKSGRNEMHGKRTMDVVIPEEIESVSADIPLNMDKLQCIINEDVEYSWSTGNKTKYMTVGHNDKSISFSELNKKYNLGIKNIYTSLDTTDIIHIIDKWYDSGLELSIPEECLRYMKPQATEFKAAVMMNTAALYDWARIRMCRRAQKEIRDLCTKMINMARSAAPELFPKIGPSCVMDGYCPELEQCEEHKGIIPTKTQYLEFIKNNDNKKLLLDINVN